MKRFDIVITAYSLLLLIGGVIGYAVAGSILSLLMSSIFTILLISALFLHRSFPQFSNRSVYILLSALTLFFGYRWYSVKFMPSGMLCIVTIAVILVAWCSPRTINREQ